MPPVTVAAAAGDVVAIVALSVLLYADKIPLEFFTATFASLVVARGIANKNKGDGDGKGGGGIPPGAVSGLAILGGLFMSYLSRGRIAVAAIVLGMCLTSCNHERASARELIQLDGAQGEWPMTSSNVRAYYRALLDQRIADTERLIDSWMNEADRERCVKELERLRFKRREV